MDKTSIISYWSYDKCHDEDTIYDYLAIKLADYYSEQNDLDLISLNLLDESSENYYWFICKKTGELYFINLIINNKSFQLSKNIIPSLSEVNKYTFKQIDFDIIDSNKTKNNICNIIIGPNDNKKFKKNKNFIVKNITINDKSVININKPSRTVRYIRRRILSNDSRKRLSDYDNNNTIEEDDIKPKRTKKDNIWDNMIAASSVRNYLLNDPLIDYLKEYNIKTLDENNIKVDRTKTNQILTDITSNSTDTFTRNIMDAGIDFEQELFKIIKNKHKIVKVAEFFQAKSKDKFDETIKLMKDGCPIIYQGVLHNFKNKTYGLPDLIVRSDYINKLMGYQVIDNKEANIGSSLLGTKWHYKIIDIKHSIIPLRADGNYILNSDSIPAYKGQLYIYTTALNEIQGIKINKAFIWGKKYIWESKKVKYEETNFLNKLGIIDYDFIDSNYVEQTNKAINWLQQLKTEGNTWKLLPFPSKPELFPNMKNEKDGHWKKIKNELNEKINDITSIIYCGVRHRKNAHAKRVYKWTDKRCTSKLLGFKPRGKQSQIVDSVININQQEKDIIRPLKVKYDRFNWLQSKKDQDFYLDFETLNSNFGSIIKDGVITYNNNQFIFMIGVGYYDMLTNNWIFKTFIMKNKSNKAECEIFQEFYKYINNILKQNNKKTAKFYHWSGAEPLVYNNFKNKNKTMNISDNNYYFYDLYKVFINEPIVVKGALNYSLKSIAKALKTHSLIETCWDMSSPCSNGLNAMILANKIYENYNNNLVDDVEHDTVMKEIIKYNEVDCKVIYEIHELLKSKL